MTALWSNDGTGWMLLEPSPFDAEASLHSLVEDAPHLLPLSRAPRLAVLGREVPLGSGYADLLAVETSGRLVLIEVKLAKNAEARRVVVAQILAYAAFLHGLDAEALERDVLGPMLRGRGFESVQAVAAAVASGRQYTNQRSTLRAGLQSGHARQLPYPCLTAVLAEHACDKRMIAWGRPRGDVARAWRHDGPVRRGPSPRRRTADLRLWRSTLMHNGSGSRPARSCGGRTAR